MQVNKSMVVNKGILSESLFIDIAKNFDPMGDCSEIALDIEEHLKHSKIGETVKYGSLYLYREKLEKFKIFEYETIKYYNNHWVYKQYKKEFEVLKKTVESEFGLIN